MPSVSDRGIKPVWTERMRRKTNWSWRLARSANQRQQRGGWGVVDYEPGVIVVSTEGLHHARPAAHVSFWWKGGLADWKTVWQKSIFPSGMLGRQGERDKHAQASGTQSQRKEFGKKHGSVSKTGWRWLLFKVMSHDDRVQLLNVNSSSNSK